MKRIMLSLLGMIVCVNLYAEDMGNGDKTIPQSYTPPAVLPKRDINKREIFYDEFGLPYRGDGSAYMNTFGSLCRASLMVIVGKVESVRERDTFMEGTPTDNDLPRKCKTVDLTVRVSEYLSEKRWITQLSFTSGREFDSSSYYPDVGEEVLVFLTDKLSTSFSNAHPTEWNFDRAKAEGMKTVPLRLTGDRRAMIVLEKDTREAVLASVKEYIRLQTSKDADAYRAFLSQQIKSPVLRLRNDALWDMIWFVRSYFNNDVEKLRKASQDTDLDERVKGYLRYLIRDEKTKETQ